MKNKSITALVLAATLLCGMTGCSKNEVRISEPESSSSDSQSFFMDNSTSDGTSSGQGDSSAEFNFDEAVKNITLFGHKISLPCTIADFGEDFSLNSEPFDKPLSAGENRVLCNLIYKGLNIGGVTIADCTSDDNYNDKVIDTLLLGFAVDYSDWPETFKESVFRDTGWYQDLIEVDLGGITFELSEEQVKSMLGSPTAEEPYFDNGKKLTYTFFQDDEKSQLKRIEIGFLENELTKIDVYYVVN